MIDPAGFRTHILVCVGSALFMLVSMYRLDDAYGAAISPTELVKRDCTHRFVVVLHFWSAPLHEGLLIKGLDTAASLWIVGYWSCSRRRYVFFSTVATAITMLTLVTFHRLGKAFCWNKT